MDRNAIFFPDGSFAAPRHVYNLDDIPETHRDFYEPHAGGPRPFRLKTHIWNQFQPFIEQIETAEREKAETIAQADARLKASEAARHDDRVTAALSAALASAKVPSALIRGAASLLKERNKFDFEAGYEGEDIVVVDTPVGLQSLPGLIDSFLESDEGTAYRSKTTEPDVGPYASMIQALKQRR